MINKYTFSHRIDREKEFEIEQLREMDYEIGLQTVTIETYKELSPGEINAIIQGIKKYE